jgi:hypothetical protein
MTNIMDSCNNKVTKCTIVKIKKTISITRHKQSLNIMKENDYDMWFFIKYNSKVL